MGAQGGRIRESGSPSILIEALRLCIVIFLGTVGYQVSKLLPGLNLTIGLFDQAGIGALLGASAGYVVGGIIARITGRSLRVAEAAFLGRSVEEVLAGLVGAGIGVVAGAALSWPMLFVRTSLLAFPVIAFVCVTTGTLGYRVGIAQRRQLLRVLGPRAGLVSPLAPLAALPRILDTSVAIDGRVLDVVRAGFLHGTLLVPQPVLDELQGLADAEDDGRRARGRRGLQTLEALRHERGIDFEVTGDDAPEVAEVDAKLLRMTLDRGAALLTLDTNLAKAAALAGCRVMNLHALTLALRPAVTAGEAVSVQLTRPGKEPGQGVGYLDDGTMVVVERARDRIGDEVVALVTSVLTTANGRMVFARRADLPDARPASSDSRPGPAEPRPAPPRPRPSSTVNRSR